VKLCLKPPSDQGPKLHWEPTGALSAGPASRGKTSSMASREVKAPKGPLDSFQGGRSELASFVTESALEDV